MKAKLLGYIDPKQAVLKYPETDQSIPAHYARAYAYHLGGYPDKAVAEADALLAADPHDPYFLELKGQSCSKAASRRTRSRCCAKRSSARAKRR